MTSTTPPAPRPRTALVVEDERTINDALAQRLRAEGYVVEQAFDGPSAVERAAAVRPDVVLLDVMLPGFDGLEVCRRVQAARPVLVGLGVGADDYLTKPFSMREVVARVAALLRRVERAAAMADERPATLEVGGVRIDPGSRRTTVAGEAVHLTPTEFDLLLCLARAPGQVLSRERLLRDVWDWGDAWASASASRTVDSHVKALRSKVGASRIRTVHGVGYALEDLEVPA